MPGAIKINGTKNKTNDDALEKTNQLFKNLN